MADTYRAVLAVVAEPGSPSWGDLKDDVLRVSGLERSGAEHARSGDALLILLPPTAIGRLAGGFVQDLADDRAVRPERLRLGLGLDVGMCHHDGRGWFGDAMTAARSLAEAPAEGEADVRLVISDAARELMSGAAPVHTALSRFAPVPVRSGVFPAMVEAVDAVAAPVAAFAEQLPVLLSADVAPADVLAWMYRVLGVDSPQLLDDRHGRRLLAGLIGCYRRRGTARGLAELIELRYGVAAEVIDPGATTWSATPQTPVRQPAAPVIVRLGAGGRPGAGGRLGAGERLDGLDEVIRSALPVGATYRVSAADHLD